MKPTILDRAISYVAPIWGRNRAQARLSLNHYHQATVARTGASNKGSLAGWRVRMLSRYQEEFQRKTLTTRLRDLHANDPHAASIVGTMALNTTGYGLVPQSRPDLEALGVEPENEAQVEAVAKFARQAERLFKRWSKHADEGKRMSFGGMQYMAITRFYVDGEFFMLPIIKEDNPDSPISLALQAVDPLRVKTPANLQNNDTIRDGILLGQGTEAAGYYVANPANGRIVDARNESDFRLISARQAHRPGMLHGMLQTDTDQVRGISILAPVIEVFFNLYDYLDYELLGAILAASFPVAITSETGPGHDALNRDADPFDEVRPGQVVHLRPGEDIHVPHSSRPSNSFKPFVNRLLRAAGAACGQPYERVVKDFSETNYSSARAALLEAWKGDRLYQQWLVEAFCSPTWDMALEEFYLTGQLETPKGLPGFYTARPAWCNAAWIPPARGSIDPKKEEEARALALKNGTTSRHRIAAEDGENFEDLTRTQAREKKLRERSGLTSQITVSSSDSKEADSAE